MQIAKLAYNMVKLLGMNLMDHLHKSSTDAGIYFPTDANYISKKHSYIIKLLEVFYVFLKKLVIKNVKFYFMKLYVSLRTSYHQGINQLKLTLFLKSS